MPNNITVRAGDTEPITITCKQSGSAVDLSNVSTATFYARKRGESSNHVDGATLTQLSPAADGKVSFDPAGAKSGGGDAFDASGTYLCYVLLTWSDGDETRHPADETDLVVTVTENYE